MRDAGRLSVRKVAGHQRGCVYWALRELHSISERLSLSCPDRKTHYAGRGFHVPTIMAEDDNTTKK
jgi:hypothetical protein